MNRGFLLLAFIWALSLSAQENGQKGEYWYELGSPTDEWNEIFIPNEIIKKVKGDFSQLRIYSVIDNGDTLETPYIVRNNLPKGKDEPINCEVYNKSENYGRTFHTFQTKSDAFVNKFQLKIKESDFDEKVSLEGSDDGKEWFSILEDYRILSIKKDNVYFRYTDLEFPRSKYSYFRVSIPKEITYLGASIRGSTEDVGIVEDKEIAWKIEEDKEQNKTNIFIDLKEYQAFHSFTIDIDEDIDYFRKATLYFLRDSSFYKEKWHMNYSSIFTSDLTSVQAFSHVFNPLFSDRLKLTIHNGNNQALRIKDVKVQGNLYSLVARFNGQKANHFLMFSDEKKNRARYDIERFEENIPNELSSIELGAVAFHPFLLQENEPFFKSNWWVWGIMIVLILLLGRFTIQMLKDGV